MKDLKIIISAFLISLFFSCKKTDPPEPEQSSTHWYQLKSGSNDTLFSYYVPTGFTPNGDGMNDLFYPKGYFTGNLFEMKIFSRNGSVVFESTNKYAKWDGRSNSSSYVFEEGIYFLVLKLTDENETEYRFESPVMLYK
jgi:gliding motility-associated-like protein